MYYTIYKIVNLVNGKIYIGKHQTKYLEDEYMGSGKILKRAIRKYGIEQFRKSLLYIFEEKEDMDIMEAEIVNEEFISRLDTYNLKVGGESGWDFNNLEKNHNNIKNKRKTGNYGWKNKGEMTDVRRLKLSRASAGNKIWLGKKHKKESKKKIGEASSIHQKGKGNSQFGTCWIYSESYKESMKIKKEDLVIWLDKGWIKGRKMK